MGWTAFATFGLPEIFVAVFSILIGGVFVAMAWKDVVRVYVTTANCRPPTALYAFTTSVFMYLMSLGSFVLIPDDILYYRHFAGLQISDCVLSLFVACGFLFLIISIVLVRRNSEPGTRMVAIGSKALFVISLLGFIGIIAGLLAKPSIR